MTVLPDDALGDDALLLDALESAIALLPLMFVSSKVPAVVPDCTQPVSLDDLPALSLLLDWSADWLDGYGDVGAVCGVVGV